MIFRKFGPAGEGKKRVVGIYKKTVPETGTVFLKRKW